MLLAGQSHFRGREFCPSNWESHKPLHPARSNIGGIEPSSRNVCSQVIAFFVCLNALKCSPDVTLSFLLPKLLRQATIQTRFLS